MMRFLFYILFILTPIVTTAQIILEHDYPSYAVRRLALSDGNVVYLEGDVNSQKVKIYHEDHSLWKTVDLGLNLASISFISIRTIDRFLFNQDSLLEMVVTYGGYNANGNYVYSGGVYNENGSLLFQEAGDVANINGSLKYLTATKVYDLPSLTLEQTYLTGVTYLPLDNDYSQLYYTAYSSGVFKIYKDDHTLVKAINIPPLSGCSSCSVSISDISKYMMNPDSLYEVIVSYQKSSPLKKTIRVINENGNVLYEKIGANNDNIALTYADPAFEFGADKLLLNTNNFDSTTVLSLPDFATEHAFDYFLQGNNLDQEGLAIYPYQVAPGKTSFSLIKPTYQVWETLPKPETENWFPSFFSRHLIDTDDDLEFGYLRDNLLSTYSNGFQVRDASDNSLLLNLHDAQFGYLSELPGKPLKLIVSYRNGGGATDTTATYTKVWGFQATTGITVAGTAPLSFTVSPNPGYGKAWVDFQYPTNAPVHISVTGIDGAQTYEAISGPSDSVEIPAHAFPGAGMYFLQLTTGNQRGVSKIIRM